MFEIIKKGMTYNIGTKFIHEVKEYVYDQYERRDAVSAMH